MWRKLGVVRLAGSALVLALGACMAPTADGAVVRHAARLSPAPDPKRAIEVLELSQAPARPVRVLGVIRLESNGPASLTEQPDHAFWARQFQAPARSLGADAVIGLRFTRISGESTQLVSGLAVEYVEAPPEHGCGCVILVPPAHLGAAIAERDRARLSTSLQATAAEVLEKLGWYVVWSTGDDENARNVGQEVAAIGQRIDAELIVSVDTVGTFAERAAADPHSIVSSPGPGHQVRMRTGAALIGAGGDTTWTAVHDGSGIRFVDLSPGLASLFETRAVQRARELRTVLAGVPAPRPGE